MSSLAYLDDYTKAATKIQAGWRGHSTRQDKKKEIEEIKKEAKVLETYRTDKYILDQFCVDLKKFKLTLDKFFRICDETLSKKITSKQFMDQISNLGIKYTEETK